VNLALLITKYRYEESDIPIAWLFLGNLSIQKEDYMLKQVVAIRFLCSFVFGHTVAYAEDFRLCKKEVES